ncbi:hypothetical protein Tco_0616189 [Tanacetum coccineum]
MGASSITPSCWAEFVDSPSPLAPRTSHETNRKNISYKSHIQAARMIVKRFNAVSEENLLRFKVGDKVNVESVHHLGKDENLWQKRVKLKTLVIMEPFNRSIAKVGTVAYRPGGSRSEAESVIPIVQSAVEFQRGPSSLGTEDQYKRIPASFHQPARDRFMRFCVPKL